MAAMFKFSIHAVLKKYKSQHNDSAQILPREEFEGDMNAFKTRLWALAEQHIKCNTTIVDNTAEIDQVPPSIDDFSNFIVVWKNGRGHSFGGSRAPVFCALLQIKETLMQTFASGDEIVQVVICSYGRKIGKHSDYTKVMTALQGGENVTDQSGAPNQARFNDPPPPQITLLFQCQSLERRQLREVQQSLTIAMDFIDDSEKTFGALKRGFDDMYSQVERYGELLQVHKRVVSGVLRNVRPWETESRSLQFGEIPNQDDIDHLEESDQENQ
ncbi:hypothetical protein BJ741DRAFT_712297 [Chytriomyces cf. hyalinus JEL632]|nr:hypothetical protein BJ741DRAFT_712297 [Chytriomyces cf. hyalinus JEL632]